MAMMIMEVEFNCGGFAELEGSQITFWEEGESVYIGSIDGFKEAYPSQFNELLSRNLIKAKE